MRKIRTDLIIFKTSAAAVALFLGLTGEAVASKHKHHKAKSKHTTSAKPNQSPSLFDQILVGAETKASPQGKAVLLTGKNMIAKNEIGSKGCWDYINKIYSRAGFNDKSRKVLYQSKKKGPYASLQDVQPGDWLYYVNHSYHDVEHSGIFIDWVSRERNEALILSYAGENRPAVARYKTYDLSSVYRIVRPTGESRPIKKAKALVASGN